jgi:cyclase
MMQQISNNVFVENGFRSCNTSFVVTSEGCVVIDTPMIPSEAKKWRDEITRHGPIRYVINCEPHTDHATGNCWLGGTVIGHEGTRQTLLNAKVEELLGMLKMMAPDNLPLDSAFKFRPPEITFSQKLSFYLGKHSFHLTNMPGHTPFQVAVYVPEERMVFTGDNVVQGMPFLHQAVPYEWLESLKQLQKLDIDKVIPGHGNVCDKSYLKEMYDTISYLVGSVQAAIDKGWTLEETIEKVTFAEKFPALVKDERMTGMRKMHVAHLYEVMKKK